MASVRRENTSMGRHRRGADTHVVDLLEPYLLGGLATAEEARLEAHLIECDSCRGECDHLAELGLLVAALPVTVVRELEAAEVPLPPLLVAGGKSTTLQSGRFPRRWDVRKLVAVAAALVVGIASGAVGWNWAGPDSVTGVPVGNESMNNLPGRLSVTLTDVVSGADVQAAVVGLRPGADFELIAVDTDLRVYSVTHGTAGGGPQQLVGSVPVAAARILLFAVVQGDDTVVAVSSP